MPSNRRDMLDRYGRDVGYSRPTCGDPLWGDVSSKRWKLVVTELGTAAPVAEVVVESENWMSGFKLARGRLGEPESIPAGSSCTVSPDGRVNVLDPARRRAYVLVPLGDSNPAPAPSAAIPVPEAPKRVRPKTMAYIPEGMLPLPTQPPQEPAARVPKRTMAYLPGQLDMPPIPGREMPVGAPSPQAAPMPAPAQPAGAMPPWGQQPGATHAAPAWGQLPAQHGAPQSRPISSPGAYSIPPQQVPAPPPPPPQQPSVVPAQQKLSKRTMAYLPGQLDMPPLPTREVPVGAQPLAPTPPPPPPPRPQSQGPVAPVLVRTVDLPPTDESPVFFHERTLVLPRNMPHSEVEALIRAQLDEVRKAIVDEPAGHLVQVHAFDHTPSDPPTQLAIGFVQWKGWRDEVVLRFPAEEHTLRNATPPPSAITYPAAAGDARIDYVLDAFDDVWFLTSPKSALEFAARLLEELFKDGAILAACLRDGDLRVGARRGFDADRVADVLPLVGITGRAIAEPAVISLDAPTDPRADARTDGPSVGPVVAVRMQGTMGPLGVVRVARARGASPFSAAEADVIRCIGDQLALFLRVRGTFLS